MFAGKKVREMRKKAGLTMAELGKKIGISEAYVSMLETGKRECPDGKVLYLIAKTLNCLPSDLTDNTIMLAFAASFAADEHAQQPPPSGGEVLPETPTTLERENAFLRGKVNQLQTEIVNLELQLHEAKAQLAQKRKGQ